MTSPKFQARHYEAIADALASERPPTPGKEKPAGDLFQGLDSYVLVLIRSQWFTQVVALSEMFNDDNPNYDEGRFFKACFDRPSALIASDS